MANNGGPLHAHVQSAACPLSDTEAISTVQLFQTVPPFVPESIAEVARRFFEAGPGLEGTATFRLAVWPDGTCSMLAYNPDWPRPRPEQILRAYQAAYRAGTGRDLRGVAS